jgi:integrase
MEKPYVRRLHPHALRHAFAAFMFYRTYHGDRGSLQRIAYYMGHAAPTTSMIYLSKLNLIDSERTWERLWLGRGSDWNQAIGAR